MRRAAWAILLCLCGCSGYRFVEVGGGGGPLVGASAVTLWEDRADEPGLGAACARALRARLGPSPSPGEATWEVRGEVLGVRERALAAVGGEVEVEVSLTLTLKARELRGERVVEASPQTFVERYRGVGGAVEVSASRRAALRGLCAQGADALAWELWEALEAPQEE